MEGRRAISAALDHGATLEELLVVGVIPTALVMRARGRNSMRLDAAKAAGTTWVERVPPGPAPETMKNLF